MSKLIKQIAIIIGSLMFLSCINSKIYNTSNNLDEIFYSGSKFNLDVFVKITNNTTIIDWFYEEGIPRTSFSDTLFINKLDSYTWTSKTSRIYKNKNKMYLETKSPYDEPKIILIKLKLLNKEQWYRKLNINKNAFFLSNEYLAFMRDTTLKIEIKEKVKLWQNLNNKYKLREKIPNLNHDVFLKEFIIIKQELLQN